MLITVIIVIVAMVIMGIAVVIVIVAVLSLFLGMLLRVGVIRVSIGKGQLIQHAKVKIKRTIQVHSF